MNYLAHLFFAENSTYSMLGNLMGDFVKGDITNKYNIEIREGIRTHRMIDKYTDSHETVLLSKKRISSDMRRFSGIMIDVFYDHFLAIHWNEFSNDSLENFINNCYEKLSIAVETPIPENLSVVINKMVSENMLLSYKTVEGIEIAINRISNRIKYKNNLYGGIEELINNYHNLEKDFLEFFPQLTAISKF
jgi:acyl carrier protein phosphodiesterase